MFMTARMCLMCDVCPRLHCLRNFGVKNTLAGVNEVQLAWLKEGGHGGIV